MIIPMFYTPALLFKSGPYTLDRPTCIYSAHQTSGDKDTETV